MMTHLNILMLITAALLSVFLWAACAYGIPPKHLSEWNVHSVQQNTIAVSNGTPYTLVRGAFSDHALKMRSMHLPITSAIDLDGDELTFPVGTVLAKSFYYLSPSGQSCYSAEGVMKAFQHGPAAPHAKESQICMIETRLLEKQEDGWIPHVYSWLEDEKDAIRMPYGQVQHVHLLDNSGRVTEDFEYQVPSLNECRQCHQPMLRGKAQVEPIGPKFTWRLNLRESELADLLPKQIGKMHSGVPPNEESGAASERLARDYLDINCGFCHNSAGAALSSALFLDREEQSPTRLGVCKRPTAVGSRYGKGKFDVQPGAPEKSILIQRMSSLESKFRMPQIGRNTVDDEGIAIVSTWISQLQGTCNE